MKGGSQYVLSYLMIFLGFLVFGGLIALIIVYNKNKGILHKNKNNTKKNTNEANIKSPAPTYNIKSPAPTDNIAS